VVEIAKPEAAKPKTRKPKKTVKAKAATRVEKVQAVAQKRSEPTVLKKPIAYAQESGETRGQKKQVLVQEKPRTRLKKRVRLKGKKSILKSETGLKMAKKIKDSETENTNLAMEGGQPNGLSAAEKAAAPRRKKSSAQDAASKKKKRMFIILDGERSALVDEKGLMAKLLAGVSPNARYFEATEIELRLQIAHKK
jgi:hypothetical protein